MSNRDSDILRGSRAWDRLRDGIPRGIEPDELRGYLHDLASILTVIVAKANEALDQIDELETADDEIRNENKWIFRGIVTALISILGTLLVIYVTTNGGQG